MGRAAVELVDGEVVVSPSLDFWHQEPLRRLIVALSLWADRQRRPVTIGHAPLDVRFAQGRILQPEAFVLLAAVSPSHEGPITRVPELCVEVLSSDRVHDRVTKRMLYAASGVREYWVVEPTGLVERWSGPGLSEPEEPADAPAVKRSRGGLSPASRRGTEPPCPGTGTHARTCGTSGCTSAPW